MIIIKVKMLLHKNQLQNLYEDICKQKENGVIVLPNYCEVIDVPDDVQISIQNGKGGFENECN